jgi:hypothetical protein
MTSKVKCLLEDHFSHTHLDKVVVYGHWVGLLIVEVSVEIWQFVEEELQVVVVDSLSLVGLPRLSE